MGVLLKAIDGCNLSFRTFAIIAEEAKGGRGGKGGVAEPWRMLPHLVISCIALCRKAAKHHACSLEMVLHCIALEAKEGPKCALLHQPGTKELCQDKGGKGSKSWIGVDLCNLDGRLVLRPIMGQRTLQQLSSVLYAYFTGVYLVIS